MRHNPRPGNDHVEPRETLVGISEQSRFFRFFRYFVTTVAVEPADVGGLFSTLVARVRLGPIVVFAGGPEVVIVPVGRVATLTVLKTGGLSGRVHGERRGRV